MRGRISVGQRLPPPFSDVAAVDAVAVAILAILGLGMEVAGSGWAPATLFVIAFSVGIVSPLAAIAAVGGALPFVYHPVALAGGSWSLLELSVGTAVCAVGLRLLILIYRERSLAPLIELMSPSPLAAAALALLVVGVVSLFTVADERYLSDSIRELRWTIVEPVALFFCFRWAFRRRGALMLTLATFLAVGLVVAISGGAQLLRGHGVVISDGVERATGPYPHPNNLALYLDRVAVVLLALAILLPRRRRYLVPPAVITGLGLAATLSRGAAIGYLGAAAFLTLTARIRYGWRWLLVGGVAVVAIAAAIGPDRLTDRGSAGAKSSRELIWNAGIRMLRDHPLTGVGLDQFLYQYNRRYVSPAGWPERYTSHPHDIVLDVWLRLGLLGMAMMAALAVVVALQAWRRPSDFERRALWGAGLAALIAGLIHGLVDNGYFLPDLAIMTWLLIALIESTSAPNVMGANGAVDG